MKGKGKLKFFLPRQFFGKAFSLHSPPSPPHLPPPPFTLNQLSQNGKAGYNVEGVSLKHDFPGKNWNQRKMLGWMT